MDNLPSASGTLSSTLRNNSYFGADGPSPDKIDPLYNLIFSRPINGTEPQESKLATYMQRGAVNPQSINKGLAALSIDGTASSKVLSASGSDFIPSGSAVVAAAAVSGGAQSSSSPNFLTSYPGIVSGSPVQNAHNYSPAFVNSRDGSPGLVAPSPRRPTPSGTSPPHDPAASLDKPLATYQENVGGTTYFYPTTAPAGASSASPALEVASGGHPIVLPSFHVYPGTPSHLQQQQQVATGSSGGGSVSAKGDTSASAGPAVASSPSRSATRGSEAASAATSLVASAESFYTMEELRLETLHRNALVLAQPDPTLYPELPPELDQYHELCPLEPLPSGKPPQPPHLISYPTSTYKATHSKSGARYCLRRVHGFRLSSAKCMPVVEMWKRLQHANIVQLREVFTTKAFSDNSIVFVYDYHPGSETLLSKHFSSPEQLNGYVDPFSADPNAPRPYSHQKNALLRQHASLLPEAVIWSYVIQLTSALRVIHTAGLACRTLEPSKVIITGSCGGAGGKTAPRLRLSCCGIADVIAFDASASNPLAMMPVYQQDDLSALGRLVLALACKSLLSVQRDNLQTSMELVARSYSSDLRNLIVYLLSSQQRGRTVTDLMPMIGARFYTQLDAAQLRCDLLENELAKEVENGRLCRLLVKLGTINERPEVNMDPTWSETGDRYMLKLFRDYVFHQVTEDGRPWLDMAHVVNCLNKLDAGTQDKVYLMSRDEQSVLVVSYAELKHCLEQSFGDIMSAATRLKA